MKSQQKQLEKRGFLPQEFNADSCDLSFSEKLELIKSEIPTDRTLAARLLKNEIDTKKVIDSLIKALSQEKKLYPKIEISNTLEFYGKSSVKPLIKVLGEIGSNQHKVVPEKEFKKYNYPLPRDIAGRIIAHIGIIGLQELINSFESLIIKQLTEAIDAIGYICFYNYYPDIYDLLKKCYTQNQENELVKWKILRAFSAFPESETYLKTEKANLQNTRLQLEIDRSISLINKRN